MFNKSYVQTQKHLSSHLWTTFIGIQAQENQQTCFSEHYHLIQGKEVEDSYKIVELFLPRLASEHPSEHRGSANLLNYILSCFLKDG